MLALPQEGFLSPCLLSAMTLLYLWTSLVAQMVRASATMQETQVRYLGWEDPLEKEMATHSSTLALKIPWMEEPWMDATVHRVTKSRTRLSYFTFTFLYRSSEFLRLSLPTKIFLFLSVPTLTCGFYVSSITDITFISE